jgi:hypothetical protein
MPLDTPIRQRLNVALWVGIADAVLLVVLLYVAFVDRDEGAIGILGPLHGLGFVALVAITATGSMAKQWGWWFPAIVVVTAGPLGTIVGDVIVRRRLRS